MRVVKPLFLALALLAARAEAKADAPISPAAGWATAYLVNSVFLAEFDSVLSTLAKGSAERKEFLSGQPGQALGRRALFAFNDMEGKSQGIFNKPTLKALLEEQKLAAKVEAKDVEQSFANPALRDSWAGISRSYAMDIPSCPIDASDVKAFAAHQKSLLAGEHGANPNVLLKPIANWTLPKVQCLVFALMASTAEAKVTEGFEPLHLLRALSQTASPMARDMSLKALLAVRFLELNRYGETLAVLVDLADMDSSFRLPYEMVQRVFSIRQKGEGAVALQGI